MAALAVHLGLDAFHLLHTSLRLQDEGGILFHLRLVLPQEVFYIAHN